MRKSLTAKLLGHSFSLLQFIVLVILFVPVMGMALSEGLKIIGYKTIPVSVIGTGSMYPSLFWAKSEGGPEDDTQVVIEEYRSTPQLYRRFGGVTLFGKKYLAGEINRGDMVAFKNSKTQEILANDSKDRNAGFIKRVIGVPGDTVELRDGFVYLNSQLISEPYIASPRSTYGGESLKDCQKLTIPPQKYFVLGDNRKVSSDSRFELGLVDESDIEFFLPLQKQQIYHSLWRDTSKDDDSLGRPTLSSAEFVERLNQVRSAKKVGNLKTSSLLVKSAQKRGEHLLKDQHTSYGMKQAIDEVNYSNIVLGEFVSYGHFSAKELVENLLYNPTTAKQVLNSEFSDVGVSAVNLEVNGCPSQIIVGHLGGYIPASYDSSVIESWKRLEKNLSEVIPSWESAVGNDQIDQTKLGTLLTLLYKRQTLAKDIVATMDKKAWLTAEQQVRIKADEVDAKMADQLVNELNQR